MQSFYLMNAEKGIFDKKKKKPKETDENDIYTVFP